jgi:hypothetical protein
VIGVIVILILIVVAVLLVRASLFSAVAQALFDEV